jgi:hypothetical protein
MKANIKHLLLAILTTLALLALLAGMLATPGVPESFAASPNPTEAVREAWRKAQAAGSYRFTADIVQSTHPLPTINNVGQTSRQEKLHFEGWTDLPSRMTHMQLWSQGGSVLNAASGVEVRVAGDRAYARQGAQPWQEVDDFTGMFAPGGDFMAFLAGAQDIAEISDSADGQVASGNRQSPIPYTRYTYRVDGPGFAVYMRDQLQNTLVEKGELPHNVTPDLPRSYVEMTGDGELWISSDGLPLRQIVRVTLPEVNEQRVEAEIKVYFSDFGGQPAGSQSGASTSLKSIIGNLAGRWSPAAGMLALAVVVVIGRRSRRVYTAVAIAVIVSMLCSPLLQSAQAASFARRQAARAEAQKQRQQENGVFPT